MLTNTEIHKHLNDATEEVSKINSETFWTLTSSGSWQIRDSEDHLLGWVNAKVSVDNGVCIFSYRHDKRTYKNVKRVADIEVDAPNLDNPAEFKKLVEFDNKIIEVHSI